MSFLRDNNTIELLITKFVKMITTSIIITPCETKRQSETKQSAIKHKIHVTVISSLHAVMCKLTHMCLYIQWMQL